MRLDLYSTSKKINSFVRPGVDTSHPVHTVMNPVYFKDDNISMSRPKFFIAAANYAEVNYCVLSDYDSTIGGGRVYRPEKIYYWITDIVHDHQNRWWIECEIDLLATWKDQILSQAAFIERSASHFNPMIIDNVMPLSNDIKYDFVSGSQYKVIDQEGGCWAFMFRGSAQGSTSSAGGVSVFILDSQQVSVLGFELNAPATIQAIRNLLGDVQTGMLGLKFLPIPMSQLYTHPQAQPIKISSVTLGASGYPLQAGVSFKRTHILGMGAKRHDYRDTSYGTRFKLFLPGVGLTDISGEDYVASSDSLLTVETYFDVLSGVICYTVYMTSDVTQSGGGYYRIGDFSARVAIDIPLTTYMQGNPIKAIGGAVTMAGLAVGGCAIGFSAKGALTAMGAGMFKGAAAAGGYALYNTFQGSGTMQGGFEGALTYNLGKSIELFRMRNDTTTDPALIASTMGRPCYSIHQLSALSGYTKTQNFHLNNTGYMTKPEQEKVENMFNNEGVFI